jgi:hypothetical protein
MDYGNEYFHYTGIFSDHQLKDVVSTYRLDLFKAFQSKYPQFPVTIQNLPDQEESHYEKKLYPFGNFRKDQKCCEVRIIVN